MLDAELGRPAITIGSHQPEVFSVTLDHPQGVWAQVLQPCWTRDPRPCWTSNPRPMPASPNLREHRGTKGAAAVTLVMAHIHAFLWGPCVGGRGSRRFVLLFCRCRYKLPPHVTVRCFPCRVGQARPTVVLAPRWTPRSGDCFGILSLGTQCFRIPKFNHNPQAAEPRTPVCVVPSRDRTGS